VIDLDIKAFFDTIDHELLLKAVRHHTDCRWVLLYVERWLKAPMQTADGSIEPRTMGTPQGGVISPLLANLFLHYVFDAWMSRELPHIPFERYADDIICHVRTRREAVAVLDKLKARFAACGLALSPQKTKIVYCQDEPARQRSSGHVVRLSRLHVPAEIGEVAEWQIRCLVPASGEHACAEVHSQVGPRLGPAAPQRQEPGRSRPDVRSSHPRLDQLLQPFLQDGALSDPQSDRRPPPPVARRKFKSLRQRPRQARAWLARIKERSPKLFPHWQLRQQNGRMLGAV
jgi:hypothetical protein